MTRSARRGELNKNQDAEYFTFHLLRKVNIFELSKPRAATLSLRSLRQTEFALLP